MTEALQWLMDKLILLNLMAFVFGVLFGINWQKLQEYFEKKEIEKDEN